MKRVMVILVVSLSILTSFTLAIAVDIPAVLLILRDGMPQYLDTMLTKEVEVMNSMLERSGFRVVAATTAGLPTKGSSASFTPNLKLSEVRIDDYEGVIIACMGGGALPYTAVSPKAVSIVKTAVAKGQPVAASHGSVIIIAEAGVLVGKRYGYWVDPLGLGRAPDDRFTGAIYGGTGLVQDSNIITCGVCPQVSIDQGLPDCTVALTQAFISALTTKK